MAIIFLYGMQLKMIAAVTKSMGIGHNGMLPWKVPADLSHFSRTTIGEGRNAIIMGRKTWESLPVKPLPKRINIVLTTDSSYLCRSDRINSLFTRRCYKPIDRRGCERCMGYRRGESIRRVHQGAASTGMRPDTP
jgi:dihydrofolate reductase